MAWLRVEDTAHSHPAVLAAGRGGDERQVNEALGWLSRCGSWAAEHLTDGFVPEDLARQYAGSPENYTRLFTAARRAKQIVKARAHPVYGTGWQIQAGEDAVLHIRTREEVELDRARRGTTRLQDARNQVRLRDGDQCRYCAAWVDFRIKKGKHRGTYDHPDPADRDTFVVCCGDCNSRKGKRTPVEADMPLLPAPDPADRHFTPDTQDKFAALGLLPPRPGTQPEHAPSRTGTPADAAANGAPSAPPRPAPQAASGTTGSSPRTTDLGSASGSRSSTNALPRQPLPGRDGIGSGRDGPGSPARASPPRKRSRRGGRRTRAPD